MSASGRVHVVDDDDAMRTSLGVLLQAFGFEVTEWAGAMPFLDRATLAPGDCLLLDVNMPMIGGFELIKLLHERETIVPIVLMTGNIDADILEKARDAGAVALLEKPFTAPRLAEAISDALAAGAERPPAREGPAPGSGDQDRLTLKLAPDRTA